MNLQFFELLALFAMQFILAIFLLVAVGLGAFVVYRTKRDSSEPFIQYGLKSGDAGQVSGAYAHETPGFYDNKSYNSMFRPGSNIVEDEDLPPDGGNVEDILYGTKERRQQFQNDISKEK